MARRTAGRFTIGGRDVSWIREGTLSGRPLVLLAHGAGAPMDSPFMAAVSAGLVARRMCVTRFHFPYMEERHRSGSRRPPDPAKRLLATWRSMVDVAARWRNRGPIVLAGKSMGGRMASLLLATEEALPAVAALYFGYPLHPPGRPDKLRSEHLPRVPVPQLFISGTRDPLCDLDLLRPILRGIPNARLIVVEGGDHSLTRRRSEPFAGSGDWLDAAAEFLSGCSPGS